jgi:hypothetical protein
MSRTDRTEGTDVPLQVVSALPQGLDGKGSPGEVKRGPMLRVSRPADGGLTEAMLREMMQRMGRRAW